MAVDWTRPIQTESGTPLALVLTGQFVGGETRVVRAVIDGVSWDYCVFEDGSSSKKGKDRKRDVTNPPFNTATFGYVRNDGQVFAAYATVEKAAEARDANQGGALVKVTNKADKLSIEVIQ